MGSAKRSGTRQRQATRVIRQVILGAKLDRMEDFTPLWMKFLRRCFTGPNYEYNLCNTWPLEVVAWWFWKSSRVCEIIARTDGFRKIDLLGVI